MIIRKKSTQLQTSQNAVHQANRELSAIEAKISIAKEDRSKKEKQAAGMIEIESDWNLHLIDSNIRIPENDPKGVWRQGFATRDRKS